MNQLDKAQLQQVQGPKQVNAMEGVNMMVNKRRQRGQQVQNNPDQFEQSGSGHNQDDAYDDQSEEVQYVNNYEGQLGNALNQQKWRSQGNWGNQCEQGNWNSGNNNNQSKWGNNNQNWGNQGNQGNWGGNNKSNWGGNSNQGGWNNNNQGNRGRAFKGLRCINNQITCLHIHHKVLAHEMGRIETMFEKMIKKNTDSDAQLASHNTSTYNLEVQLGQISQSLNTRPKW
ncbi:uncharacterized protein [Nicotiana sylvestris]|uniref:uncharacterized protein n=1 Tax=Nicotiana sylvestris TaxID=4096 RepID=UPI00388CC23E